MAAELQEDMGLEVQITPGGMGAFDVQIDGVTLFDKKQHGRFPEPGEITRLVQAEVP